MHSKVSKQKQKISKRSEPNIFLILVEIALNGKTLEEATYKKRGNQNELVRGGCTLCEWKNGKSI